MKTANCTATALVLSMIGQASVLSSPANAHAYLVDCIRPRRCTSTSH